QSGGACLTSSTTSWASIKQSSGYFQIRGGIVTNSAVRVSFAAADPVMVYQSAGVMGGEARQMIHQATERSQGMQALADAGEGQCQVAGGGQALPAQQQGQNHAVGALHRGQVD